MVWLSSSSRNLSRFDSAAIFKVDKEDKGDDDDDDDGVQICIYIKGATNINIYFEL